MKRVLIKLGGAALDSEATLDKVTRAIEHHRSLGHSVVLVHGGGPAINSELRLRNISWNFVGGQRVTTPQMIDVIESTLCGSVNRKLVRHFNSKGIPAVGLSGTDRQTLLCKQASAELGLVGAIERVNASWMEALMNMPNQPVPVISPIGVGMNGEAYNINADWAATHLAVSLNVDELLFLTDQLGVLDEEGEAIPKLDSLGMKNMIECKVVSGGMLTKALAAIHALNNGVKSLRILRALDADIAVTDLEIGTQVEWTNPASYEPAPNLGNYASV